MYMYMLAIMNSDSSIYSILFIILIHWQKFVSFLQTIIKNPTFTPVRPEVTSTTEDPEDDTEDPECIKCAIFYSITSTQRGQCIRHAVIFS